MDMSLCDDGFVTVDQLAEADGVRVLTGLISGGADATGEAVLGLVAYLGVYPDDGKAARALDRYAEGIEAMASGAVGVWPFGAILPSTGSQSLWHAWGGLAPAALAAASAVTGRGLDAAVGDVGVFTPQLMTSGGPFNAWSPVPGESQIAYGVQSRVESLLRTADATGGEGLRELAALVAGWFFGANPAGEPAYDPATGVTIDGIEPDGAVNRNSGAESTIHGLLAMIALDSNLRLARTASSLTSMPTTHGMQWIQAEDAQLGGGAAVVEPDGAWTGESNWQGSYVLADQGGTVRFDLDADARGVVAAGGATAHPVIHRLAEDAGTARWTAIDAEGEGTDLGELDLGSVGGPGSTEWDGVLKPVRLKTPIPAGTVALEVVSDGRMELDALMLLAAITEAVLEVDRGGRITLHAASATADVRSAPGQPGTVYRADGTRLGPVNRTHRNVPEGAFAITRR
ncbi:hypothetical protein ACTXKL_14210 [Brachybacterium tyrofermentans]|uniref:hypothetical protein n=1 Tax=Brachybacterium tyrofermentans TaxID=47848 RepID=UPI003FCFDBD6